MSLTGTSEDMVRVGISIADIAAGMYAFSGILAALLQRATTGRARAVEVALFDALAEWLGSPAYYAGYGGAAPRRTGGEHATIAPYGPYTTEDGDTVVIAVQNEREWTAFCTAVLGEPGLVADERFARNSARVAHREELNELISKRLATLSGGDIARFLDRAGIAHARINTMADFAGHPALTGRNRWRDVTTPGGPVRALLPPVTFTGAEARMGPVPALGEHTRAILRSLGRTDAEIAKLRAAGVI
jgi:formyl-CoA transferase